MRYGSRLLIDLNLLSENVSSLRDHSKSSEIIFMVKANAYGHGLIPISRFSHHELGIKEFGCASLGEAVRLRDQVDGEFEIYAFSDIQLNRPDSSEAYLNKRIMPVLSSIKDLDYFLSQSDFKNFPISLKFNTGMNRIGFPFEKAEEVISKLKANGRKTVHHLMTHLSSASMPMTTNKRNLLQKDNFKKLKEMFKASGLDVERTSISNSGACEQSVGFDESHIRPGLMLYGPSSLLPQYEKKSFWKGKIISQLETYIIDVFDVDKGAPVGYGANPVSRAGQIAIIALGYGDGISTRYSGVEINHNEQIGKIVGRVNMDMAQVLFEPDAKLEIGEKILIWDHEPKNLKRICEQAKMIPYESFCSVTSRVPREYI